MTDMSKPKQKSDKHIINIGVTNLMKPFKNPNPINKIGEMINTGVAMISARIIGNKKVVRKRR